MFQNLRLRHTYNRYYVSLNYCLILANYIPVIIILALNIYTYITISGFVLYAKTLNEYIAAIGHYVTYILCYN